MSQDPSTPPYKIKRKHNRYDLSTWSRETLEQRFMELDEMLNEFQESSKELEKALEDELQSEEATNQKLTETIKSKDVQLQHTKEENLRLTNELNQAHESSNTNTKHYEETITSLKQNLVSIEISNDYMESNDRVITSKLELANQFNNELLEKLALLENDLDIEKRANIETQLYITNYQNTIKELKDRIAILESKLSSYDEPDDFDSTMCSMGKVLSDGPPEDLLTVPRVTSLQKVHDLTCNYTEKLQNWNLALYSAESSPSPSTLKSPSTTQVTNHLHTTTSNSDHSDAKSPFTSRRSSSTRTSSTSRSIRNCSASSDDSSVITAKSGYESCRASESQHSHNNKSKISPSPSMINLSEKLQHNIISQDNSPTRRKSTPALFSSSSTGDISSLPASSGSAASVSSVSALSRFHKKSLSASSASLSSASSSGSSSSSYTHKKKTGRKSATKLEPIEGSPSSLRTKDAKLVPGSGKRGLFSPLKALV